MSENISQKSINNAISAYLLVFISWLLLFNKNDQYVNNRFVRGHVKTATILHILILFNYIIFISFGLFKKINAFGYSLNIVIANTIFVIFGILLVRGAYNAWNQKNTKLSDTIKFASGISLGVNNNESFDEKYKFTLLLSYIPFVGYIVGSKYNDEKTNSIIKLNLIITFVIMLIYIFGHENITNLLSLMYLIFICFCGVYLYVKDELILINLPNYILPNEGIKVLKSFFVYLHKYLTGNFIEYKKIKSEIDNQNLKIKQNDIEIIEKLPKLNLSRNLIYIPIVNFVFFFQKPNKYTLHIRNGIVLSFIFILMIIFSSFGKILSGWILLLIFPICFGFGMLDIKNYRMPYIYEIYELFIKIKNFFSKTKKKFVEKKNEVHEESLKVSEQKVGNLESKIESGKAEDEKLNNLRNSKN